MRATRWRFSSATGGRSFFKKYSPISELGSIAAQHCSAVLRGAVLNGRISGAYYRPGPCSGGQRHQPTGGTGASGVPRLGGLDREPQELYGRRRAAVTAHRRRCLLCAGAVPYHLLGRCMRQRNVPAKQGKRPPRRRRAEAHSGGGELSWEANGAVMV